MHVSRLLSSSLQKLREGIGQTGAEPALSGDDIGHGIGTSPSEKGARPALQTGSVKM